MSIYFCYSFISRRVCIELTWYSVYYDWCTTRMHHNQFSVAETKQINQNSSFRNCLLAVGPECVFNLPSLFFSTKFK